MYSNGWHLAHLARSILTLLQTDYVDERGYACDDAAEILRLIEGLETWIDGFYDGRMVLVR